MSKKFTPEEIQNNRNNAEALPDDTSLYTKMGFNWEIQKETIIRVGYLDGKIVAYCWGCDVYHLIEEMTGDTYKPCGIKPRCKRCENERQRELYDNGDARLQNITITDPVAEAADRSTCLAALEKIWNEAKKNKHITFDNLIKMGFDDKTKFIYITRWFGICDELKQKMEDEIRPNIEAYYVGQTNGKDPLYNGSGKNVEKLKQLIKEYPNIKEEVRIVEAADLNKVNEKEYIKIKETGAIIYGLNIAEGSQKASTISIKIQIDPSKEKELDTYYDLLFHSKESGIPLDEMAKNVMINGVVSRWMFQKTMDDAADNGDILPFAYWQKKANY